MERPRLEGTFVYDDHRYLFDVIIPGVLGLLGILVACALLLLGLLLPIALLLLVLCSYVALNTFGAHAYPRRVVVDGESLRFESFGRADVWPLDEIDKVSVRESAKTHSVYLRLPHSGLLRGRYFIGCGDMTDDAGERADALYQFILDTEAYLNPNGLRVRARAVEARRDAGGPTKSH